MASVCCYVIATLKDIHKTWWSYTNEIDTKLSLSYLDNTDIPICNFKILFIKIIISQYKIVNCPGFLYKNDTYPKGIARLEFRFVVKLSLYYIFVRPLFITSWSKWILDQFDIIIYYQSVKQRNCVIIIHVIY